MNIWAILPAAGIGRRMGSSTPKQYLEVCGKPVLLHSINRLLEISAIEHVLVMLNAEDKHWEKLGYTDDRLSTANGGDQRFISVLNGLKELSDRAQEQDWILVHDAVRPCVSRVDIENLIEKLQQNKVGGLLAAPINNTVKQVNSGKLVTNTVNRGVLWSALTPQMFRYGLLLKALEKALGENLEITDEATAIEALGLQPKVIPTENLNIKVTTQADLKMAEFVLSNGALVRE